MTARDSTAAEKRATYKKAWYQANKERLKVERAEYHKAYRAANAARIKSAREANREKMRLYLIDYHRANKDKLNAAMRAHYAANASEYKERARKWKEENPERFKEMRAKVRAANPEKFREISRADWQKHNAKRKAAKHAYRAAHPDLGAHHCRLRQTRKQQATPAWADLNAIKAIYRRAAELTKQTGERWHVDHEIPLKHSLVCGLHVPANLRVIPGAENQSKGNRLVD